MMISSDDLPYILTALIATFALGAVMGAIVAKILG